MSSTDARSFLRALQVGVTPADAAKTAFGGRSGAMAASPPSILPPIVAHLVEAASGEPERLRAAASLAAKAIDERHEYRDGILNAWVLQTAVISLACAEVIRIWVLPPFLEISVVVVPNTALIHGISAIVVILCIGLLRRIHAESRMKPIAILAMYFLPGELGLVLVPLATIAFSTRMRPFGIEKRLAILIPIIALAAISVDLAHSLLSVAGAWVAIERRARPPSLTQGLRWIGAASAAGILPEAVRGSLQKDRRLGTRLAAALRERSALSAATKLVHLYGQPALARVGLHSEPEWRSISRMADLAATVERRERSASIAAVIALGAVTIGAAITTIQTYSALFSLAGNVP